MPKTAYEMRISDWSSDVCSSDLPIEEAAAGDIVAIAGLADAIDLLQVFLGFVRAVRNDRLGLRRHHARKRFQRLLVRGRSEERREGQEWVSTSRFRGSPYHYKNKNRYDTCHNCITCIH